jgi:hypothetical protein
MEDDLQAGRGGGGRGRAHSGWRHLRYWWPAQTMSRLPLSSSTLIHQYVVLDTCSLLVASCRHIW